MKFLISNKGVQVFAKSMRYMAKHSTELIIRAFPDFAQLSVTNPSLTLISQIRFDSSFFLKYEPSTDEDENLAKVSLRGILNALKSARSISGIEIFLNLQKDCLEMKSTRENGIECLHEIILLDTDETTENNSIQNEPNMSEIICKPSLFKRLQGNATDIRELRLQIDAIGVLVENYVENAEEDCQSVRLHYILEREEFESFDLKQDTTLVFDWSDFEGIVDMAQKVDCNLRLQFSRTGKPLIVIIDTQLNFTVRMVEMTMSDAKMRRQKKHSKILTYKEKMAGYLEEKNVAISSAALGRFLSPSIAATDPTKSNLTSQQMDDMISAVQQSKQGRSGAESTIIHSTSDEDAEMREVERFEQFDVEIPVIETAMRPSDAQKSQASKRNLSEIQNINEERQSDQTSYFVPNSPTKQGDDIELGRTLQSQKLSTQDKRKVTEIGNLFLNRKPDFTLANAKKLCTADSDSE